MDIALPVAGCVAVLTLAVWLFTRAVRMFAELRKIATSLIIVRWALDQAPTDPAGAGPVANANHGSGRRTDG